MIAYKVFIWFLKKYYSVAFFIHHILINDEIPSIVSRAADRCVPFFDMLRESNKFEWTDKCEQALQDLKEHLGRPLLLSKPIVGEKLYLYLLVSKEAVSAALIREDERIQWPIYYVSKRLLDAET